LTLIDDDASGIIVSRAVMHIVEGGSSGSSSGSFGVVLASEPTSFVQVSISTSEGLVGDIISVQQPAAAAGIFPIRLTFGPGNWSAPQVV